MTAPLGILNYDVTDHPQLTDKYAGLATDDLRWSHQFVAESLLGLTKPDFASDAPEYPMICAAVAIQISFQLEKSLSPDVLRSVSNTHPGNTTNFRDRYVSPTAWALVSRATGVKTVGFSPPGIGV